MKLDFKQEKTPSCETEVRTCHVPPPKQRSVGAVLALTFIIIVCLTVSAAFVYFIAARRLNQVKLVFKNDKCDDTSVHLKPESWVRILRNNEDSIKDELQKLYSSPLDQCFSVANDKKFDCYPDAPATEEGCLARGCCWDASSLAHYPPLKMPCCYYPQDYMSYNITSVKRQERGLEASLKRLQNSAFPGDVENIRLLVYYHDHKMLRIQLKDADHHRYEVPLPDINDNLKENKQKYRKKYEVKLSVKGDLIVTRVKTNQAIFHANLSRLVFSDQFIQLSSFLPSHYIYGLGQHKTPLLHSTSWERLTLFNYGPPPEVGKNLYGSHPFYLALENNGKASGVLLFNSNPMDIILQPAPAITYRPIGGILDFFIFLGPSPENVIQQYTELIGRPFMPPYWSLGFHLCKYNYSTLENTIAAWNRTRSARIPFDTQWNDIDYMASNNDFTYDKTRYAGLPEFVKGLHNLGMHYMQILDPGVSNTEPPGTYPPYDEGIEMDIFVKNSTGQLFMGKVWNRYTTVFTDFLHPNGTEFWTKQFRRYHAEVEIDGAWIDMNEPTSFYDGQANGCPTSRYNDPQYLPGDQPLYTLTLCMTAKHYNDTLHYNVHNLYALSEAIATNKALSEIRKKRPFIISRASSPGLGHYSGNWNGDIYSTWDDMRWTIPVILNFNMYGIPMTGGDICGFENDTNIELCARWMALGAYYPFSRNHNSNNTIDQDPASLGKRVIISARNNLLGRYFLLPHLYTLFFRSHVFGDTVARPLFFEYPHDRNTYAIDTQFLWGGSLMIIPVLEPNVTSVTAYFPEDVWYDLYTGRQYENTGTNITLDASTDMINLAVRGGHILSGQEPSLTTTESRLNEFSLIVALNPGQVTNGELYWDDGDSVDSYSSGNFTLVGFVATHNRLFTFPKKNGYTSLPPLGTIRVLGCQSEPKSVYANGKQAVFTYNSENKVLRIAFLNLSLLQENSVHWVYPTRDEDI